jgi:hypothetical protein
MKLLQRTTEADMVAAYLKAELHSKRFAGELKNAMQRRGVEEQVIATPDINNQHQNEQRAQVLGDYRGYRQHRAIFTEVPDKLAWYKGVLSPGDIVNLKYVDYSYWNKLTDNTHLVKDAVKNIRKGKVVFNVPNDRFLSFAES